MSAAALAHWNDGRTKSAIIDFVGRVTTPGSNYVPPEERLAVFDNDGTLWAEKPAYVQLDFLVRRLAELSAIYLPNHPRMIGAQSELQSLDRQIRAEALKVVTRSSTAAESAWLGTGSRRHTARNTFLTWQ